jgi:hypothetical protein
LLVRLSEKIPQFHVRPQHSTDIAQQDDSGDELYMTHDEVEALLKREKKRLPFPGRLLEDAIDYKPGEAEADAPSDLTTAELLAWISSDGIKTILQEWKENVFDKRKLRFQLLPGTHIDHRINFDTVDTLTGLCFTIKLDATCSETDAYEATAYYATQIIKRSDCPGSPMQGMEALGHAHWCAHVAVNLFVTAFCDLTSRKRGWFHQLLGGPVPKKCEDKATKILMKKFRAKRGRSDEEMSGPYGYEKAQVDYSRLPGELGDGEA